MNKTITLPELINLLSATTNSSEITARQFITELFSAVSDALAGGKKVKIKGLGTFTISESDKSIEFLPDTDLADAVNHPFAFFEAVELDDEITDNELAEAEMAAIAPTEAESDEATLGKASETQWHSESNADMTDPESIDPPTGEVYNGQNTEETVKDTNETTENESHTIQSESAVEPKPKTVVTIEEGNVDPPPYREHQRPSGPNPWLMLTIGLIIGIIVGYLLPSLKEGVSSLLSNDHESAAPLTNTPISQAEKTGTLFANNPQDTTVQAEPSHIPPSNEIAAKDNKSTETLLTDTIGRNKFLTTMSRKYFGRYEFWVYIYEENADHLGDPDKIAPGTVVTIPSPNKYDIDATDPQSLQKAKLKAVEIYAPYQK